MKNLYAFMLVTLTLSAQAFAKPQCYGNESEGSLINEVCVEYVQVSKHTTRLKLIAKLTNGLNFSMNDSAEPSKKKDSTRMELDKTGAKLLGKSKVDVKSETVFADESACQVIYSGNLAKKYEFQIYGETFMADHGC